MRHPSLVVLALLALACGSPASRVEPIAAPQEASVRPGANDRFLDPELDVDRYVGIFEGESREIARARDTIVARLDIEAGQAVADVGAGTGLFLEPLARAVGPDGLLYAVDIAPLFVEHLQQRAQEGGLTQVKATLCSERSVDLPDASVDMAFVCDTYHHFEFPRSTLASLYRAVRPGGALVIVDFEREPGISSEWVLDHVRAGRQTFITEIEAAGFRLMREVAIAGLEENYVLRFKRP